LAILEIQGRFQKLIFSKFTNKNDEQIFTLLSFKISQVFPKYYLFTLKQNIE